MKLKEAAKKVEDDIKEALTYCGFPSKQTAVPAWWGRSQMAILPLCRSCARLRHVASTQWDNKKYMNMKHLDAIQQDASIVG